MVRPSGGTRKGITKKAEAANIIAAKLKAYRMCPEGLDSNAITEYQKWKVFSELLAPAREQYEDSGLPADLEDVIQLGLGQMNRPKCIAMLSQWCEN